MVLLLVLGVAYIWITKDSADRYFQEATQRLNSSIAQHMVDHIQPIRNGEVDTTGLSDLMHSMMIINPDVEVYLLDTEGKILSHVAPYKKVKLTEVRLGPINQFLETKELKACILGDDPRKPGRTKVFSAAEIRENNQLVGYAYVILVSEDYDSAMSFVWGNYILRVGIISFLVTLLAALVIGLALIYFITKNLNRIVATVKRFKEGDMHARMPADSGAELQELATTFNEMADTLVKNIDELKAVENLRRELIANVSHDLRTPLAIMRGYVETLIMKDDSLGSEERQRYLNTVMASNHKLEKMVGDLFELSKLEAKQVTPVIEPFFIVELVQDITQKYKMLAGEKGIEISLSQSAELPMVLADIALVERVLQNLLDNAIKFTPSGGKVTISLAAGERGVEIKVSDTGKGIAAEDLPYVFDRYHQANKAGREAKVGAGLGLAIVKKILEIHNSTIEISSKLQQGTSFRFHLPAYEA